MREGWQVSLHRESQERESCPRGPGARVTLGTESPSWRDLTPKVRGHRQGRAGRHWGSGVSTNGSSGKKGEGEKLKKQGCFQGVPTHKTKAWHCLLPDWRQHTGSY